MSVQLLEPTPIQLMKTSQAAAFLNITPKRLRAWRSEGVGPAYIRLGNKAQSQCRYHPNVLQEYIEQHTFG